MSHTLLAPHQGTLEALLRPIRSGLLVRYLTPRHVNLLSGDFSFFIVEAQRIDDGQVGPFVAPCLLRGNGLVALAGIEAVGADLATFHGLKGCGKLDHGPLPVSFGNPTVRISGLSVDPWS
jgi:TldD protein